MSKLVRAVSLDLDAILGDTFDLLDHGFVRVIDYMGNDGSVVQMARVSYGEGTETPSSDEALIRYMMRHAHTSPFEGCEIKLHVKMPIFVARQWIRHRTANVNEYSGRYSIMREEAYVPSAERLGVQSITNKQGTGVSLDDEIAKTILNMMEGEVYGAFTNYKFYVSDDVDLSKELARINLPLSTYTEFYWKIDLHNLLHFLKLRGDSHAQEEIRVYAEVIEQIVEKWVPVSYKAFVDYKKKAATFSRMELEVLQEIMAIANLDQIRDNLTERGCSKREVNEFFKHLT